MDVSISPLHLKNMNPSLAPRSARSLTADLPQVPTQDTRVAHAGCCRTVYEVSPKKTVILAHRVYIGFYT